MTGELEQRQSADGLCSVEMGTHQQVKVLPPRDSVHGNCTND